MTLHAVILGITIATLIGSAYHLLRGGSLPRLGLFLLTANLSFFLGQFLSQLIQWELLRLGALNLFPAILATLLGLLLTSLLAGEDQHAKPKKGKRRR
jgi:hypothetical protein